MIRPMEGASCDGYLTPEEGYAIPEPTVSVWWMGAWVRIEPDDPRMTCEGDVCEDGTCARCVESDRLWSEAIANRKGNL